MARGFLPSGLGHRPDGDPLTIDAPRVHQLLQILTARYPDLAALLPQLAVAVDRALPRAGEDPRTIDAPRVRELLQILPARYPVLAALLRRLSAAVEGEIHSDAEYLPLTADSEIYLVPRIAGGASSMRDD